MDAEHEDTEHLAQIRARGSIWTLAGMDGWMQRRTDGRWTNQWVAGDAKKSWPVNPGSLHEGVRHLSWTLKDLNKWK